jgi:hypothetical protein
MSSQPLLKERIMPSALHPANDRDRGLSLLYLFTAAAAVMVGCVLLAGAVDSWWILILTTALLGVTTFAVFAGIMRLLADEGVDEDR